MLFWRTIKFLGSVGILFSQNTCGGFASCWIIVRNIYSRPTNSALIKASHAINKSLRLLAFFCAPVFRVNSPSCLHLIFFPSKMHFIKWHIYLPKETELWKKILWECPKPKTTTVLFPKVTGYAFLRRFLKKTLWLSPRYIICRCSQFHWLHPHFCKGQPSPLMKRYEKWGKLCQDV